MNILVIGGTIFLGRHFVEAALAAGHSITLFHRGKSNPQLFPDVEHIYGDRRNDDDLAKLSGRRWDALYDPSGYFPADVKRLLNVVGDAVDHYTFISSISVYASAGGDMVTEESPVIPISEDMPTDKVTGENYGAFKAECDRLTLENMPGRSLVIRPGLIVGPHDPSDRFTYWPWRIAQGGRVLAPGDPNAPVQFIDGRDLAAWNLRLVEAKGTGVYNATGPSSPISMQAFLEECRDATGSDAEFVWASEEFLLKEEIAPYMQMPLWIPADGNWMSRTDLSRAHAAGLTYRPIGDTVRDTLDWFKGVDRDNGTLRAGITRERELELI